LCGIFSFPLGWHQVHLVLHRNMTAMMLRIAFACLLSLPWVSAQLSGSVGPKTPRATKASTKTCNIMDYGGKASATTDNSAAIQSAWAACKSGGEVLIPSGSYGLANWVTLDGGSKVSIDLQGTIFRTGTAGGHMIVVENTDDFELYSSNSKGAVQGYGYTFHTCACRAVPKPHSPRRQRDRRGRPKMEMANV
jgi:rhamnogalacturonan hydrolase